MAEPITIMTDAAKTAGRNRVNHPSLLLLMLFSGFAGLGYEMAWTRAVSVALGHEIIAVLAVIAAFFSGLGFGAWLLDKPIRASQYPARWYAALEFLIAAWALALIFLVPQFNALMVELLGTQPDPIRHWALAFGGTFVLLLPATACMGGTLPAMERFLTGLTQREQGVAGLYAANTFGAVIGTLLTTMLLIPTLGLQATLIALAGVNLLCGVAALRLAGPRPTRPAPVQTSGLAGSWQLGLLLALTGLLAIGFEVVVIRVLSQVLENTVFTFASLLSVYLMGTAIGAAIYARRARSDSFQTLLSKLLLLLAAATLLTTVTLYVVDEIHGFLTHAFGNGYAAAVSGEALLALIVFIAPTLVMGALFSHLVQNARHAFGVGRALGINTLAAATAPLVFGVLLLPIVGTKTLMLSVSACYLLLALIQKQNRTLFGPVVAGVAAVGIAGWMAPPLRLIEIPENGTLDSYAEGVMASVAVVSDQNGAKFLKVNDHFTMGSSVTQYSDFRQSHVPLLLHDSPETVLYLGLGTGTTFAATGVYPQLKATGVELIPEVAVAIDYFDDTLASRLESGQAELVVSDARRFVRATDQDFDVVIGEVFHPSRDGSGALYTREHFEAIDDILTEDGLFFQWLPLFQLDLETLATITRTFIEVFPDSEAYLAHYSLGQPIIGLVGYQQSPGFYRGWLRDHVRSRALAESLISVELNSDFDLFGLRIADRDALSRFAAAGPVNTDDLPVVTYQAPGFVYAAPEPANVRLEALLERLAVPAETQVDSFELSLQRFREARDRYIKVGGRVTPSADPLQMVTQLSEPFLKILAISPEFTPAYRPLVELSYQIADAEPEMARALLDQIVALTPTRPQAQQLRRQLFGD